MKTISNLIFFSLLISCNNSRDLRFSLKNETSLELRNIVVGLPETTLKFDILKPNTRTNWINVESAYNYGFLEFEDINGKSYILQPIDYVGEKLYNQGNMTFIITNIDTVNNEVTHNFTLK